MNVVSEMIRGLSDSSPVVREAAAEYLGDINQKEAIGPLLDKLDDHYSDVRLQSAMSLHTLLEDSRVCPPKLIMKLQDPKELVRIEIVEIISEIGDENVLPELWKVISDRSGLVRSYVACAIGSLGSKKDIKQLEEKLQNEKSQTAKLGFYEGLYILGQKEVLTHLLKCLSSKSYRTRTATANILSGTVADASNAAVILEALEKAANKETTIAANFAIKEGIREITEKFCLAKNIDIAKKNQNKGVS